jgi:large subunit ribosomal protein L32e
MKKVAAEKLERALKTREKISSERPDFHRSEYTRFPRLGDKWRSSKGIRSKMRLKKRSRSSIVETGYRGPVLSRGLRSDGKSEVLVHCVGELAGIDASAQVVRLGGDVGKRKRLEIIQKAKELELYIVNIRPSEKAGKKPEEKEEEAKPEEKEEAKTEEEAEEKEEEAEEKEEEAEAPKAQEEEEEKKEEPKPAKKPRSRRAPKKQAEEEPEEEEEVPEEPAGDEETEPEEVTKESSSEEDKEEEE